MDPRNSFIAALAFSDLTLCVFTSPLTLWYTLEGHWPEAIDFGQGRRQRVGIISLLLILPIPFKLPKEITP